MMLMYGDNLLVWIVLAGITCYFWSRPSLVRLYCAFLASFRRRHRCAAALSRINRAPLASRHTIWLVSAFVDVAIDYLVGKKRSVVRLATNPALRMRPMHLH